MRASDADRDRVTERLRSAAGEGRLATHELEQRLETALSARTYGELDLVLRDLPGRSVVPRRTALGAARTALALATVLTLALLALVLVAFAITGVFAGWVLWMAAAWWFFGYRRRFMCGRRRWHHAHTRAPWHTGGPGGYLR